MLPSRASVVRKRNVKFFFFCRYSFQVERRRTSATRLTIINHTQELEDSESEVCFTSNTKHRYLGMRGIRYF